MRVSPRWVKLVFHLTAFMALLGLLFVSIGEVGTYREGPTVVRISGHTDVTSSLAGTIMAIEVVDGQLVSTGTPLVRLDDQAQQTNLSRLQEQFTQALLRVLLDPGDDASRRQVADLRAQVDAARAKLGERVIFAPHDGVVQGLRLELTAHGHAYQDLVVESIGDEVIGPNEARRFLGPSSPTR